MKWDGKTFPQFFEVSTDLKRYDIQLWWEIQPFISFANFLRETTPRLKLRDEKVVFVCVGRSVRFEDSRLEKSDGTTRVPSSREK